MKIIGISERNRQLVYIVKVRDSIEPVCVTRQEARIWAKMILRYWMDKVDISEFGANKSRRQNALRVLRAAEINRFMMPKVICMNLLYYCLRLPLTFFRYM